MPARTEQIAFQDQLHDLLAAFQVVGGVGEDHVELLGTAFQVEEYVGLDGIEVFDPQLCGRLADETVMHGVDLDRRDAPCAARCELVADRPVPAKRSSTSHSSKSSRLPSTLKRFSLAKSVVGRARRFLGGLIARPRYFPLTIRMSSV